MAVEYKECDAPPYLITPTKAGTFTVKVGRYKKSEHGGSVRWKYVGEYGTISEAACRTGGA